LPLDVEGALVGTEKCRRNSGRLSAREAGTVAEMRTEVTAVAPARGVATTPASTAVEARVKRTRRFTNPS
jgi:hypothetical protein